MRKQLVLVCAALVATTTACNSSEAGPRQNGAGLKKDAEIVIALAGDPGTLDPTKTLSGPAQQINRFAYDSLAYTNADGELVSGIAESWEVTPTTLTFKIRPDVTCGDGSKLVPSSIQRFFEYLKKSKSPMIGTAIPDANYKVAADDASGTFTFESGEPNGFLLQNLVSVPIVCEKGLTDPKSLARGSAGTGPYVLTEVVSADHYTLERREGYTWGSDGSSTAEEGLPARVTFRVVSNEATSTNLMLSGELDIANLTGPDRERLDESNGFNVYNVATDSLLMMFNEREGLPAAEKAVRQALVQTVDRAELLQVATSGFGAESHSMVTVTPQVCDDSAAASSIAELDPDAAAGALDSAGWARTGTNGPREKNGKPLKIRLAVSVPGAAGQDAAELLRQQWEDLGVQVDIKTVAGPQLENLLFGTADFDAVVFPLAISLPSTVYGLLVGPPPPAGGNFAALTNADYEKHASEALATPGDAGCDGWTKAEAALYSNGDVLPIGATTAAAVGRNLEFDYVQGQIDPMSVRVFTN